MPAVLTPEHISTPVGQQLLELAVRITIDGKLDLAEIKELRDWLRSNLANTTVPAIAYLHDIMARITADKVIDRDELHELHLAVERIIPQSFRSGVKDARKSQEAARKARERESKRAKKEEEKARQKEERDRLKAEEKEKRMRLRHTFAKVSGVSFPNDDGTERQEIIRHCRAGETLVLQRDHDNTFSSFAIAVRRQTGQQIGHVPEYLAERICDELESGTDVSAVIADVTGGTAGKEYRGVNFVVVFASKMVTNGEYDEYVRSVMAQRTASTA